MYRYYQSGHSLLATARHFGVSRGAAQWIFGRRGYRLRTLKKARNLRSRRDHSILRPADPADCRRRWEVRARECDEEAAAATREGDTFEAKRWARRARDWRSMIADLPR